MKLPREVLELIARDSHGEPALAARALSALDGGLGESHVAANADRLWLASRPAGGEWDFRAAPLADVRRCELAPGSVFVELTLTVGAATHRLKFSAWDQAALEHLAALCPAGPAALALAAAGALGSWAAFCAACQAMLAADAHVDPLELEWLARQVGDPARLARGQAWLEQAGVTALLRALPGALDTPQRLCLFANLVAIIMLDGLLQPAELALLDQFQTALEVDRADRERIHAALLLRHRLAVFAEPGGEPANDDGLTPLIAFCATLHALFALDPATAEGRAGFVERLVGDVRVANLGRHYLMAHDLDFLLARLPSVLNPAQRACLLANVAALAMADGELRPAEQELIERVRVALEIGEAAHRRVFDVLLLKNNLSVFPAE